MKLIKWSLLFAALACLAKDQQVVRIEVVGTQSGERAYSQYVLGTAGHSTTNCTGTSNGGYETATCNTSTTPATPPSYVTRSIRQEYVHAVMPGGQHVMLWCQAGFRKCANLIPGSYAAELSGNTLRIQVYELDGVKYRLIKYRFAGGW